MGASLMAHVCFTHAYCNDHMLCRFQKYGGFFRTSVMGNPLVVVSDQTEIKRLLQAWPSPGLTA